MDCMVEALGQQGEKPKPKWTRGGRKCERPGWNISRGVGGLPRLLGEVEPGEVTSRKEKGGHSSPCEFKVDQEAGIAEGWTTCRLGTPGIGSLFRCL